MDTAAGAVNSKQGDRCQARQLDTRRELLDTLLGQDLTGSPVTTCLGTSGRRTFGLDDGCSLSTRRPPQCREQRISFNSFTLDTSADLDELFTVSVAADDVVTNAAESTNVSLSLSGIDADASSVSVAITDGETTVTLTRPMTKRLGGRW